MSGSTNLIGDLTRAFEIANVEMLAVALPDAEVVSASRAALVFFNARREELIGQPARQFRNGAAVGPQSPGRGGEDPRIEVAFAAARRHPRPGRSPPQTWHDGDRDIMLLIGQHRNATEADLAIQNEERAATRPALGRLCAVGLRLPHPATTNSPEIYDLLGFPRDDPDLNFNIFNERVHPDDRGQDARRADPASRLSAPTCFRPSIACGPSHGDYVWIEVGRRRHARSRRRQADQGRRPLPQRRPADDRLERLSSSERNLSRSQAAARLGSFSVKRTGTKSSSSPPR